MEVNKRNSHKRKRGDCVLFLSELVRKSVEEHFEKKFEYKCETVLGLPEQGCTLYEKWICEEFVSLKNELNKLKNELNDKDMLSWHEHTRECNIAGKIAPEIRSGLRPELCTQAWCKFYEIASTFLDIDTLQPYFSVHLCEAPGAFITSLNQYLFSKGV